MSVTIQLSRVFIASMDLQAQLKTAHWNVTGCHFLELHRFFDEAYNEFVDNSDTIAERIRFFKSTVYGDIRSLSDMTFIQAYDYGINSLALASDILSKLMSFSDLLTDAIIDVIKTDNTSADILIKVQQTVDKRIFFLQSLLIGEDEETTEEDS